jgi:hypothetical protein
LTRQEKEPRIFISLFKDNDDDQMADMGGDDEDDEDYT